MERAVDRPLVVFVLLCGIAIAIHVPVLFLNFFSDDLSVIYRIGVGNDLGTGSFFRPLGDWTHWLNYRIAGPNPWAFRIVNVLLLAANAWLVHQIAHRFDQRIAWMATLLFVTYPFHLEPQVWIIGRSTGMATTFVLLALHTAVGDRSSFTKAWQIAAYTFLGSLCYEYALLIPLLLLPLVFIRERKEHGSLLPAIFASAAVVVVNLGLRQLLSGNVANDYGSAFFDRGLMDFLLSAIKVFGRFFLPPLNDEHGQTMRFVALLIVLCVLGFAWIRKAREQLVPSRTMIALMALTAIASIIAVVGGVSTRTSESDRFLYLPSAFLCIGIALFIRSVLKDRVVLVVMTLLITMQLAGLWNSQQNWRAASAELDEIIAATPDPVKDERIFVKGLPGDHKGAFILRHGYREALLFAGKDTSGIIRADTMVNDPVPGGVFTYAYEFPDDTSHIRASDRVIQWNGDHFFSVQ